MLKELVAFLILVVVGWYFISYIVRLDKKHEVIVDNWVARNNFKLLERKATFWDGPFIFRATRMQPVFKISVRDQYGFRKEGYIRLGHPWKGIGRDPDKTEIVVKWKNA